jgi:hypothetical protein
MASLQVSDSGSQAMGRGCGKDSSGGKAFFFYSVVFAGGTDLTSSYCS